MKKVLSLVLALVMLIAPVGAVSCFANGGSEDELMSIIELMKEQQLGKVKIIATMFIDGRLDVGIVCLGRDGRFLKSVNAGENGYRYFKRKFEYLKVLDKMKEHKLDLAQIVYENDDDGNSYLRIFYLDKKGNFKYV